MVQRRFAPSPLVGEGWDGGETRYGRSAGLHPHPNTPPSRGKVYACFRSLPLALGSVLWLSLALAGEPQHGLALGTAVKYQPGFAHFAYADPQVESPHRKKLRPNPLAPWELRIGQYRLFYEVEDVTAVKIAAIGYKEHNDLFIRGQRVEL